MNPAELLEAAQTAASHGMLREALVLLRELEHLKIPGMWLLRADLHRELCQLGEAQACLRRAQALGAGASASLRLALLQSPIMGQAAEVATELEATRRALTAFLKQPTPLYNPVDELPWLDFYLAYRGGPDRTHRELLGQALAAAHPALVQTHPLVKAPRRGAVRVGILSSHLCDHTIGRLNEALVEGLGRHGVDVILLTPDPAEDDFARRLSKAAKEHHVIGRHLGRARGRVASARLDVLHYPDIGMDPFTYLLAMARLAPLQTVGWGHPITSGLPSIDAFFASEALVPEHAEDQFTEAVIRLPDPVICWRPPAPPTPRTRAELGLPEGRRVYLCPQNPFKLHPDFDRALAALVRRDPAACVALLASKKPAQSQRLLQRMARNIPHLAQSIVVVPRQDRDGYLALLQKADVLLDPFPFGGGHTSLEAFAMGTPIVTWPGDQLRGRLTAAWYQGMGMPDAPATSLEDFVEKAASWAADGPARDAVRARIAAGRGDLFEQESAVAHYAEAFLTLAEHTRAARGRR